MKKFLISIMGFAGMLAVSFYAVFSFANGYTDAFYVRFTTPQQKSLILGSSKAAQAIQPEILNRKLSRSDIFNYSFTNSQSPYGPTYLTSIKRKLDSQSKNGIFILAVDPWGISSRSDDPNDVTQFRERNLELGNTFFVNQNPNANYLIKNYTKRFINLLTNGSQKSNVFLHKDGWLEVSVYLDPTTEQRRMESKRTEVRENRLKVYKFSELRLSYLVKTIEFLKDHGNVYLVRLPIHPSMKELDLSLMPDFREKMQRVANQTKASYHDMHYLNSKCQYLDGDHIFKESGKKVTETIADLIESKKIGKLSEFEAGLDERDCR